MRMTHYFLGMALLAAAALVATAATGIFGAEPEMHLALGLFASILTVATHTMLILFMIVTGKVMKTAMQSRPLGPEFLSALNRFFERNRAYPVSGLAAVSIVAAAVLGYGQRAFGLPAELHMLFGIAAAAFNLWAFSIEAVALRENQALLDRTAAALDAIDRERAEGALPPTADVDRPLSPAAWIGVAASAWFPYLYWGLVEWEGRFARVPALLLLACAAVCAAALLAAWRARGAARA